MGNLQCGDSILSPTEADRDGRVAQFTDHATPCLFNKTTFHSCNWETAPKSSATADSLPSHLQEPDSKTLIGYKDVAGAIVEQVEELMRRDKLRNCSSSITSHGSAEEDNVSSFLAGSVKSRASSRLSRITSNFDQTVVTTVSTATRKAGNSPERNQKETRKKKDVPPLAGWSEYEEAEALRKLIYNEIISTIGKKKSPMLEMGCPSWGLYNKVEAPPRMSSLLNEDDPRTVLQRKVIQDHGAVLHLRMRCKFVHYYKLHFSRRQPNHSWTRIIEDGIESTHLTPTRLQASQKRHPTLPLLIHVSNEDEASGGSSTSSSAASSRMDFGAGPPSTPIRLLVTDAVFLDIAISGSLGLASRKRRPRAAYIDQSIQQSPDEFVVLMNRRSGAPLAVCALRATTTVWGIPNDNDSSESPAVVVRMYATKRRFKGQLPVATTDDAGLTWSESLPLYAWAEFVTTTTTNQDQQHEHQYWIYMVSDDSNGLTTFDTSPSYCATHRSSGSPVLTVTGRTWREWRHSECAVLSLCQAGRDDDDYDDGFFEDKSSDLFMKLSLSRGIDPALLICFSCFIDECMEKRLRLENASNHNKPQLM